ncbi:MXAN_6652 family MXYO-CTERM-anchored protein [Archangium lansingense]|uniref:MYXO-CTERM sorting domain-containing protein n=1 Tax=Archangium lansingense TaxID=2995310 RepID=A0ABT4A022_9BACT|nr:MXAN_6652 family MXYO-CTERM-anchored protein [Archangium lansinium]MCY1074997.1 MYXO-CTERM sorting domain-containing protein [Archangium lansinium]
MKFPSYGAAGVLTACLLSAPALANSAGMTANSGKTSQTCSTCHTGGSAPTVELTGPTTLAAGATGQYKLTITGGPGLKGGMNVAVDNTAASLEPGTDTKKQSNELTHKAAKPAASGAITFDFSLVAPPSAGTVKLFAAGNSVNGDNNVTGDAAAVTTLSVTVTGSNEPVEEEGGCSSTGGAPVVAFALTAGLALLRRRRN